MVRSNAPLTEESRQNLYKEIVGSTETLKSTVLPPNLTLILPSCGRRRSEISRSAIIFIRETMAARYLKGIGAVS